MESLSLKGLIQNKVSAKGCFFSANFWNNKKPWNILAFKMYETISHHLIYYAKNDNSYQSNLSLKMDLKVTLQLSEPNQSYFPS